MEREAAGDANTSKCRVEKPTILSTGYLVALVKNGRFNTTHTKVIPFANLRS